MTDALAATPPPDDQFFVFQSEDGQIRVEVRLQEESVWLTQAQMAALFQTTKQNISLHMQNVFEEKELQPSATVKEYLTVQTERARRVQRAPRSLQSRCHHRRRLSIEDAEARAIAFEEVKNAVYSI